MAVETWRDCVLVADGAIEIGAGLVLLFYLANQPIEPLESIQFFGVPQFCRIQSAAQDRQRFVVRLQRNGEWVTILAAQRERETRRIIETAGRAMNDFGNQSQRLERARAEIFD